MAEETVRSLTPIFIIELGHEGSRGFIIPLLHSKQVYSHLFKLTVRGDMGDELIGKALNFPVKLSFKVAYQSWKVRQKMVKKAQYILTCKHPHSASGTRLSKHGPRGPWSHHTSQWIGA